jgi:endonuclease YncB( thermonuclease family)
MPPRLIDQEDSMGAVRCELRHMERHGRVVAVCFEGIEDLNQWMVKSG